MPVALSVSLPLVMAVVLIASGIAKLRHPDDLTGWRELGVPRALQQRWLLQVHPWGEIVLGVALAVFGGVLGLLAALVAVVLMGAYTVLIGRVLTRTPDASCACFGAPAPVSRWTVVRNVWLTLVAVASAAVIWANPLWGGALVAAIGWGWWVIGAVVAAVTVFVIVRREQPDAAVPEPVVRTTSPADADEDLDYVRVRIPAAPVTLADGTVISLRRLAERKPILLLAVSEGCGSCTPVIESVERYRELLPEVDVRLLLFSDPGVSSLTSEAEPQTLHDPERYVSDSLLDHMRTPTALLLGADGMLAGGPEEGSTAVDAFVQDIYDSLHAVEPEV